jgi:formyltetrahydrofolate-dependent phosphoribosylglycinamide formyltransferase
VLISGGGTTLQNFLDEIDAGRLPAEVAVVISSSAKAYGLERARKRNIPTQIITRSRYADAKTYGEAIAKVLDRYKVELVTMAGFLKFWTIPARYQGRVMNIHPALIPAFCGQDMYGHAVHQAVVRSGVKASGCTVHFADNEYDTGPIIIQRTVPVHFEDTPDDVARRVSREECIAYPEAIRLYSQGRLKIEGRRVRVRREADQG